MNIVDHIQRQLFWYGYYEKSLSSIWEKLINKNDTIIDIGANIGYFSILAANKATLGKTYCFEPISFHFSQLQKNISLNGLTNIYPYPQAISDKTENTVIFISNPDNSGMSSLSMPENFSGKSEKTATITIDKFISDHQILNVNLIKIDVEGAELKVIQGMLETLNKCKPLVIIEVIEKYLNRFNNTSPELFNLLYDYGYNSYEIKDFSTLQQINEPIDSYAILFAPENYCFPDTIQLR
ncbi:MAG TPA: FkbM family methyltransferase [Chitinophagaceae bacterium]|nr:FkbM family methyltransferase [Chitinophagaceae bacterium]